MTFDIIPIKYIYNISITNDFMFYSSMIDSYLKKDTINISFSHLLIAKITDEAISKILNHKLSNEEYISNLESLIQTLNISKQYYNSVLPNIKKYDTLSPNYNQNNKLLTFVMDNIVHVVRTVICTNFYETLVKTIEKYLNDKHLGAIPNIKLEEIPLYKRKTQDSNTDIYRKKEHYKNISYIHYKIISNIFDDKSYNGLSILNFMIYDMPRIVTKYTLQIYEGDTDIDGKYKKY